MAGGETPKRAEALCRTVLSMRHVSDEKTNAGCCSKLDVMMSWVRRWPSWATKLDREVVIESGDGCVAQRRGLMRAFDDCLAVRHLFAEVCQVPYRVTVSRLPNDNPCCQLQVVVAQNAVGAPDEPIREE